MTKIILKLSAPLAQQSSKEGVLINKLHSSISPVQFIKLLNQADNKVNPRTAKTNLITKAIHETLETSPEMFWYKTKGILLSTENLRLLERNRVEITLSNFEFEGIMDGGHNTFAIATFMIKKLFNLKINTWKECKQFWQNNYKEMLDLKFRILVE